MGVSLRGARLLVGSQMGFSLRGAGSRVGRQMKETERGQEPFWLTHSAFAFAGFDSSRADKFGNLRNWVTRIGDWLPATTNPHKRMIELLSGSIVDRTSGGGTVGRE